MKKKEVPASQFKKTGPSKGPATTKTDPSGKMSLSQRTAPCTLTGVPPQLWGHYTLVEDRSGPDQSVIEMVLRDTTKQPEGKPNYYPSVISLPLVKALSAAPRFVKQFDPEEFTDVEAQVKNILVTRNLAPSSHNRSIATEIVNMESALDSNLNIIVHTTGTTPDFYRSINRMKTTFEGLLTGPKMTTHEAMLKAGIPHYFRTFMSKKISGLDYDADLRALFLGAKPSAYLTVEEIVHDAPAMLATFSFLGPAEALMTTTAIDQITTLAGTLQGAPLETLYRQKVYLRSTQSSREIARRLKGKELTPPVVTSYKIVDEINKAVYETYLHIFGYPDEQLAAWQCVDSTIVKPTDITGSFFDQLLRTPEPPKPSTSTAPTAAPTKPTALPNKEQYIKDHVGGETDAENIKILAAEAEVEYIKLKLEYDKAMKAFVKTASTAIKGAAVAAPVPVTAPGGAVPIIPTGPDFGRKDIIQLVTDPGSDRIKAWEKDFPAPEKEISGFMTSGSYMLDAGATDCIKVYSKALSTEALNKLAGFLSQFPVGFLQDTAAEAVITSKTFSYTGGGEEPVTDVSWLKDIKGV